MQLEKIYKRSFFGKRYKLSWRAPHVVDAIESALDFKSVIDCGAAVGDLVNEFDKRGYRAMGIEGSTHAGEFLECREELMLFLDLAELFPRILAQFDLCICFEVLEHIDPEFADVLVLNLVALSNSILVSAAPPGQGGHHHVNCQLPEYWEKKFGVHGYRRNIGIEQNVKHGLFPWRHKPGIKAYYQNLLYFHLDER